MRLERALFLSPISGKSAAELVQATFWLEGFLRGSGLLIVHDDELWQLVDSWITEVEGAHFADVLPLLRRTFSSFSRSARQQIHERVRATEDALPTALPAEFNQERADAVLPLVKMLLGVK